MRVAYADPPYPGCAHLYAGHPDYAGEVCHTELIARVSDYDAWVIHTGSAQLQNVLSLCPSDTRILAWVKGWASFKPGVPIKYAWEPVLIRGGRDRKGRPMLRDWLQCNVVTTHNGALLDDFVGGKPRAVCEWIFEALGLESDDQLDDIFPGSGAVGLAWEAWRAQLSLLDSPAPSGREQRGGGA